VSALIHAATMVVAGVYMIARLHPLFELSPAAADVGAVVGCATLLIAGTIGLAVTDLKRVIAYSTMSQIGYMIMAVSAGAYVAGLFHLMTHAFFKALLFMAAGSIIGAMAGEQSLDRMGGFRRVLPFTFACFVIGGLALSGIPPFSGFFSKDEILLIMGEEGGWHWILYVAGYVGAFLTAIYTWRMIFRAFWGEPVPEAQELAEGHLHHAEVPTNPGTGEVEDTDVGFPGPAHFIAERSRPMQAAMGVLALLTIVAGIVLIPKTTTWLDTFLEPTFADSSVVVTPSNTLLYLGLALGTVIGLGGIGVAYYVWVRRPGTSAVVRARLRPLYELFVHKWYFDELIDLLVVRPWGWFGRFGQQTFERVVVSGALVGGTSGIVRAGSAAVRALQSGLLRAYAALLLLGLVGVALYFLLQST
jgi:NADH-quinone oxidoreductase subunit L